MSMTLFDFAMNSSTPFREAIRVTMSSGIPRLRPSRRASLTTTAVSKRGRIRASGDERQPLIGPDSQPDAYVSDALIAAHSSHTSTVLAWRSVGEREAGSGRLMLRVTRQRSARAETLRDPRRSWTGHSAADERPLSGTASRIEVSRILAEQPRVSHTAGKRRRCRVEGPDRSSAKP